MKQSSNNRVVGIRQAVKRLICTWYENAVVESTWESLLGQVWSQTAGDHRFINLPKGSLEAVVSIWEGNYLNSQRKVSEHESRRSNLLESQAVSSVSKPKNLRTTPSPRVLMDARHEKALQMVDGLLYYCSLPHHKEYPPILNGLMTGKQEYKNEGKVRVPSLSSVALITSLFEFYLCLLGMYILGYAEKFLKQKLAIIEAKSKDQTELPAIDKSFIPQSMYSMYFFGGKIGNQFARWLIKDIDRCQEFSFNIKRLAAKADDEMLQVEAKKSFDILTKEQDQKPFLIPVGVHAGQEFNINSAVLEVERTVIELFGDLKWKDERPFHLPSSSAHFGEGNGRAFGGARGHITHHFTSELDILKALKEDLSIRRPYYEGDPSFSMSSYDVRMQSCAHGEWTRKMVIDNATLCIDEKVHLRLLTLGFRPPNEERTDLIARRHWFDYRINWTQARDVLMNCPIEDGFPSAVVVTLPEPLKIRSITCGPMEEYYWASYIQKWMHGHMKQHKTFQLIGGTDKSVPIHRDILHQVFNNIIPDNQFYVSGDYQAATNLISSRLSEAAAKKIAEICNLPPIIADVMARCLVEHEIWDSPPSAPDARCGQQKNGQLMGSPISFPILCLINAALTRRSQELAGLIPQGTLLKDFPCLINGDDVVFATDNIGYEVWKKTTACGGLIPSIGKNYTSKHFLVMNSVMFHVGKNEMPRAMRSSGCRYVDGKKIIPDLPPLGEGGKRFLIPNTNKPYADMVLPAHFIKESAWRPIQNFNQEHWFNMDFLGPFGAGYFRATPPQDITSQRKSEQDRQLSSLRLLFKRSREHTVVTLSDLMDPSNYQVLPGLQQSWLGNSRGSLRHSMNLVFLNSWKEVLDMGQNTLLEAQTGGNWKGVVPFSTDLFLPTSLGGMGLENTDVRGISCSSAKSRRLAHFLMNEPAYQITAMPSLGNQPKFAVEVSNRIRTFREEMKNLDKCRQFPATKVPQGWQAEQDVVSMITRDVMFESFGNVTFNMNRNIEAGDFANNVDRKVALVLATEKFLRSRRQFWEDDFQCHWREEQMVTQRELDQYVPVHWYYYIVPEKCPKVRFDPNHVPDQIPRIVRAYHGIPAQDRKLDNQFPAQRSFPESKLILPALVADLKEFFARSFELQDPLPFGFHVDENISY